ncbi:MAG: hypothetical protein ABSC06_26565 [Rhodopila sp.]|jgi:hypothetical protein
MVGIGGMAITAGLAMLPNSPVLALLEPPEQPAAQIPAPTPPPRAKGQSIDVPSELNSRPDAGTTPVASTQERIQEQANQPGGLDMDVDPNAKLALAPPVPSTQSVPEPVFLNHPTVVDTATLRAGGTTVALYGIEGEKGDMAEGLQGFLAAHGDRVTCQPQQHPDSGFVCLQPDGTDVAEVVLINGAARTKPDAPSVYRDQESAAETARRGIWESPVKGAIVQQDKMKPTSYDAVEASAGRPVKHPTVPDTHPGQTSPAVAGAVAMAFIHPGPSALGFHPR